MVPKENPQDRLAREDRIYYRAKEPEGRSGFPLCNSRRRSALWGSQGSRTTSLVARIAFCGTRNYRFVL
jgi:hypothetical protein